MSAPLRVGPLTFAVVGDGAATLLQALPHGGDVLVRFVNAAVTGRVGDGSGAVMIGVGLAERVARGADLAGVEASGAPLSAHRPGPDEETAAAREAWRRFAGTDPGTTGYLLAAGDEQLWVPRSVLAELAALLDQRRRYGPAQAPVLTPGWAVELEEQAVAVDTLEVTGTVGSIVRAGIKRRMLLDELERAGLLSAPASAETLALLDEQGCERTLGYVHAATVMRAYLTSAQRAAAVPAPRSMEIVGGAVSLDWFRLASPTPPGLDPFAWLAGWEAETTAGGFRSGWVRDRGSVWYRVEVREEGGSRPALLRVERESDAPAT